MNGLQNMQILIERARVQLWHLFKSIRDYQTNAYLHDNYTLNVKLHMSENRSLIRSIEQPGSIYTLAQTKEFIPMYFENIQK